MRYALSLQTRGLRPASREPGRAGRAACRLQVLCIDEALPLGYRVSCHRVVIDPGAAEAQAVGCEARAVPALRDEPQGAVPARVRPDGPLVRRIEFSPAGSLWLRGARPCVGRVLAEGPGMGRLS